MSVFLTGFPGFLGSELVDRLLARREDDLHCLVQARYRDLAERRRAALDGGDRVVLHTGDITEPDLGLGAAYEARQAETSEIYHLAAVYDLSVTREVGTAVNVEGTEHVLDFAAGVTGLARLHYVSTCYVSGRHDGVFTHRDLDVGQSFTNHYEATKYEAEVAVQARMAEGLPATVYRPAIAVGDSETGRTQKYDGPYSVLRLLARQADRLPGNLAVLPTFGDPEAYEVNVVPRDFVVDAIAELGSRPETVGEIYQLCDPAPLTVAGLARAFGRALGTRVVTVPSHLGLTRRALDASPRLRAATGVDPATLPYFVHPTSYTAENTTRALAGTDVACPPFEAYVDALVEFFRANPELTASGLD